MHDAQDYQQISEALVIVVPQLLAFNDDTIASIVQGREVDIEPSHLEVNVELHQIIELVKECLPLVAASVSIIKTSYDIFLARQQAVAVAELYERLKRDNPLVLNGLTEEAAKAAIRASLYAVMKDSKSG